MAAVDLIFLKLIDSGLTALTGQLQGACSGVLSGPISADKPRLRITFSRYRENLAQAPLFKSFIS
jgi:hypothetical protein